MTDRPILFSGPMVRAILEGSKTQTRRVLNPQPWAEIEQRADGLYQVWDMSHPYETSHIPDDSGEERINIRFAPGDRLYVRESFGMDVVVQRALNEIEYMADYRGHATPDGFPAEDCNFIGRWRPSIHMPRWASRITMPVTEVRVQRLQDITTDDIVAEGAKEPFSMDTAAFPGPAAKDAWEEKAHYAWVDLWDSINAGRKDKDKNILPYAWDDNPWVVAVSFDVHKGNIDLMGAAS